MNKVKICQKVIVSLVCPTKFLSQCVTFLQCFQVRFTKCNLAFINMASYTIQQRVQIVEIDFIIMGV